jgi:hypothetical protein
MNLKILNFYNLYLIHIACIIFSVVIVGHNLNTKITICINFHFFSITRFRTRSSRLHLLLEFLSGSFLLPQSPDDEKTKNINNYLDCPIKSSTTGRK